MKQVPIVAYRDGERKIIGEAAIEIKDGYLDVVGKIEESYLPEIQEDLLKGVSLGPLRLPRENND